MCQIWKQIHCHCWQSLSTHLCHSWQLQNVPDLETDTLPLLAITEHTCTFAIPGNSRMCQIWKQIHCHCWQSLSTHLCHSWQLQNVPDLETDTLPLLAITEHTCTFAIPGNSRMCQIWKQIHCHYWQSLSTYLCHSWQLQNVPDLETVLAITEHTPLPFLATYIATVGNH